MQMNASSIVNQKAEWEKLGVKLPAFDHAAMTAATKEHPIWVHFGAGNIFRGFIAALQQRLLNEGAADRGIIAADTFDYDISESARAASALMKNFNISAEEAYGLIATGAQNGAQKALAQKPLGDHSRQQRRCQKGQCIKAGDDPRHGQIAQQAEYSGKGGPLAGALQHGGDGSDQRRQKGMHAPHADAVEHQGLHQNQQQGGPGIVQPLEKHIPLVQGLVHGVTPQSTMVKSVMTKTSTSWVMSVLGRMVA